MYRLRKWLSICIVMCIIFSTIQVADAKPVDVSDKQVLSVVNSWIAKGLYTESSNKKFRPGDSIKRVEFIKFINRVFNYKDKAPIKFLDVDKKSAYFDDIAKAMAANIVITDRSNRFKPLENLSNQEAMYILYKAFDLNVKNKNAVNAFSDVNKISPMYKDAINAMIGSGYITAKKGSKLNPKGIMTRAQAITLINKMMGDIKNVAGTYSGKISGNLVVNTKDVVLKNMTINGDLYLTAGIGDGNIKMDKVTVKGRTVVRGGGDHSIIVSNSSLKGTLLVIKQDGKIRIVTQGDSSIANAQLGSGAKLEEAGNGTGFKAVEIIGIVSPNQQIKLDGDFTDVSINSPGVTVNVLDGSVGKLTVEGSASNSKVNVQGGTVNQLNLSAKASVDLKGGSVNTLNVGNTAKDTDIQIGKDAKVITLTTNTQISIDGTGTIQQINNQSGNNLDLGNGINVLKPTPVPTTSGAISTSAAVVTPAPIIVLPPSAPTPPPPPPTPNTAAGNLVLSPMTVSTGTTQSITLTYTPGQALSNGAVRFVIPSGITPVVTADTIKIGGASTEGLTTSAISGQIVTINNVTLSTSQTIILTLTSKVMPIQGTYNFYVTADADGSGSSVVASVGTGNEAKVLSITKVLDTVTTPTLSAIGLATWNNVPNATNYEVTLYKGATPAITQTVTSGVTGYNFLNNMRTSGAGIYTVKVAAKGTGVYLDGAQSAASNAQTVVDLAQVGTPTLSAVGLATWTDVSNATSYDVTLYKGGSSVTTQTVSSGTTGFNFLSAMRTTGAGIYTVKVTAKGTGLYLDGPQSAASGSQTITKLSTVAQPTWSGDTIQWTDVSNETNYEVILFKNSTQIAKQTLAADTLSYDFSIVIGANGAGSFTVTVKALAATGLYIDGDASTASIPNVKVATLAKVGTPSLSALGVATWTNVADATNYEVTLYKASDEVTTKTVTSGAVGYNFLSAMRTSGAGIYIVKVTAKGDGVVYHDGAQSDQSNSQTVYGLGAVTKPTFSAVGLATWTNVANATIYDVTLYKGMTAVTTHAISSGVTGYNFLNEMKTEGTGAYSVRVIARGAGLYLDGAQSVDSDQQTVVKLSTVAQPTWSGDTIQWFDVSNETNYEVKLFKNSTQVAIQTLAADTVAINFATAITANGAGSYTVTVKALGSGLYINGDTSDASAQNIKAAALSQVTKPTLSSAGVATWTNVANATSYDVTLYKNTTTAVTTQAVASGTVGYNFLSVMRTSGAGIYTVKVIAKGDGVYYSDGAQSIASDSQTIAKLGTVTQPTWIGNTVQWTSVANTSNYEVSLLLDGSAVPGQTHTVNSSVLTYNFTAPMFVGGHGNYTVTVQAKGSGLYLDGDISSPSAVNANDQRVTVMYYGDGDNDLEGALLTDILEMKSGVTSAVNLIVLMDRIPGYTSDATVLGDDFTDTRLYQITHNTATRIGGMDADGDGTPDITTTSTFEANMGDANTLKEFIKYCKANYPSDKYILIMSNHGGGAKSKSSGGEDNQTKSICWDDSSIVNGKSDCLYTAEITDVLTPDESVDVLAFDACVMGSAEVAYQYRLGNGDFNAAIMVASAPNVWGPGFRYDKILSRIQISGGTTGEPDITLGGTELCYDPATVTNEQIGAIFVEEQRDSTSGDFDQSLSCYDLSRVGSVKTAVDTLAVALAEGGYKADFEAIRGSLASTTVMHYFDSNDIGDWISCPFFDLYDLCNKINSSPGFDPNVKTKAQSVMTAVDDFILYSFAGSDFAGFQEGKNGVTIVCPDGDELDSEGYPYWSYEWWYNSIDTTALKPNFLYGKLSWCIDGIDPATSTVGNWFELLDSWYDYEGSNGYNGFQW